MGKLAATKRSNSLYLVTAMLALPAMLSAFIPLWAALLVGALLLLSAVITTKREKKVKA